jgi:2-methylisocitrate lyase-like PEP mutase family enzyme
VYLHHLGFQALATTSAGFAFSRGLTDDVGAVPRDTVLAHIREICQATPLPVNADFQTGHAREPEGVAENVALCIATGVAGLSIEDAPGESEPLLFDEQLAVERILAARSAIDSSTTPIVLTARCEAWLVGHPEAERVALKRLVAYADAGADCLYAPGVREPKEISAIVKAVAPKPVNVLVSSSSYGLTVDGIADLGVRRISVGAALARVAWGAFIHAAQSIVTTGSFEALDDGVSFAELDKVFRNRH